MTDLQSLIRGWEERADKIAGRSHSDDALVAAYQTCAQQLWEALTPYKESTEPRSETTGEREPGILSTVTDAIEADELTEDDLLTVLRFYLRGQDRPAPPSPDTAEGEERWTIRRCIGCGQTDLLEEPDIPGCADCPEPPGGPVERFEVVPLARATAAEDRADASETRERVTHERAEQAESQLAHYKAEVERLREALERIADTVDSDRFAPGLAIWCADEARSALTPPPAEENESA